MDEFTNYTEDDWMSWWTEVFYGIENDDIVHICDPHETKQCVDCAKVDNCWNENGLYILCTDCLAVESKLEMNQVNELDEDSPYAHMSEEEKKEHFLEMYRENPDMFDF